MLVTKTLVVVLVFPLLLLTVSTSGAQSQLQISPRQAAGKPELEIPKVLVPKSVAPTPEPLLAPFVGCWLSRNGREIVESEMATGAFALPTGQFVPAAVNFCWKTNADGAIYFQPPADGYQQLTEAMRQMGIISLWVHWITGEVDPSSHRAKFELQGVYRFQNNTEHETEEQYSCLPEGSEMECTLEGIYNIDHQPWYKEVDHFHMQRTK